MTISRIYCDTDLQAGSDVTLDKTASHHLSTVLRGRPGQPVCLFNGDGNNYIGVIDSSEKSRSTCVRINDVQHNHSESRLHTCLIQGLSRNDRMDFTLQKATELGVNRVIAFRTDLVNQRVPFTRQQKKIGHWQAVIQSAAEQSGRALVPSLHLSESLASAIRYFEEYETDNNAARWLLNPEGRRTLNASIAAQTGLPAAAIIIGPERGLSEAECETAAKCGFEAVTLGTRIMRTETAALATLSVLQALLGDFS